MIKDKETIPDKETILDKETVPDNNTISDNNAILNAAADRRKRVKKMKIWIISIVISLLILPTILCIFLFFKMISLQKQIDILMIEHYSVTYKDMNNKNKHTDNIVYAAVSDTTEDIKNSNVLANEQNRNNLEEDNEEINKDDNSTSRKDNTTSRKDNTLSEENNTLSQKEKNDKKIYIGKKVYLTFDDGPSCYTNEILDILAEYNVKATFFVIGKTDDNSKKIYKRIVDEGHTLGMHSYSHDYNLIYKSVKDFDKDFTKLSDLLYDTTGYRPNIYRFPGGSSNTISNSDISEFIQYLNNKSITYYDWNVVNGDATGKELTTEGLYNNVLAGINVFDTSIVLMHDTVTKKNTVKSLLHILQTLTEEGAEVLPIDRNVAPIQQVKSGLSGQK